MAGTLQSTTWRDTFVRVTISQISALQVSLSNMPESNTHSYITIKTTGQVPVQAGNKQVHYLYDGSLAMSSFVSLVDASLNITADPLTAIKRPTPCVEGTAERKVATHSPVT